MSERVVAAVAELRDALEQMGLGEFSLLFHDPHAGETLSGVKNTGEVFIKGLRHPRSIAGVAVWWPKVV